MSLRSTLGWLACGLAVLSSSRFARATDFHVVEAEAGADFRGRATLGLGYTLDAFLTVPHPWPRGFLVGGHVDALYCNVCEEKWAGGMVLAHALVTFWKDDLSTVTPYLGFAGGTGYSRSIGAWFGHGEVELALQSRALFDGWWIRPTAFASYSGAYDERASFGLRIAIGFAPNHGVRQEEPPATPPAACAPAKCAFPERAQVPISDESWTVCNCFKPGVEVRVDGAAVQVQSANGDLVIPLGRATAPKTQKVEVDIAGGTFSITVDRR